MPLPLQCVASVMGYEAETLNGAPSVGVKVVDGVKHSNVVDGLHARADVLLNELIA